MHGDLPLGVQHTGQALLAWFTQHEALLIFVAILLEESGIPMPIPADIAMALAGYRVAQGKMGLLEAFLIGQSATLIGSSILYWVGRRGGRPLLFRYGKLLHLSAHRIAQVERLVTRLGPLAVIIGRQIPGLRLAAPLACGVFRVRYRLFVPAMIVGSSVYLAIFIGLGMWGGPTVLSALRLRGLPLHFLTSTLLLIIAAVLLRQLSKRAGEVVSPAYRLAAARRRSLEAALLAGLGASAIMGLVINWLLALVGLIAQSPPERALLQFLEGGATTGAPPAAAGASPQRLILAALTAGVPFQVASHLVWAALYALVFEPRLRGNAAVRGLQFALLPWLSSGLAVLPLLGAGPFGLHLGRGALPLVGEFARNAIFGLALGPLYRLVRLARQPRTHEGHRHGHRHGPAALPEPAGASGSAAAHTAHDPAALPRLDTPAAAQGRPAGSRASRVGLGAPAPSARPSVSAAGARGPRQARRTSPD